MHDPKLGPDSRAAVLRAMQRLALEQSAEESVNVNSESESPSRQTCHACGSPNRKGNNFCAACGVSLVKAPEDAGGAWQVPGAPQPSEQRRMEDCGRHLVQRPRSGSPRRATSQARRAFGKANARAAAAQAITDFDRWRDGRPARPTGPFRTG